MYRITQAYDVETNNREVAEAIRSNMEESMDHFEVQDFDPSDPSLSISLAQSSVTENGVLRAIVIELADGTVRVDGPYANDDHAQIACDIIAVRVAWETGAAMLVGEDYDTYTRHGIDPNGDDIHVYVVPLAPSV